MIAFLVPAWLQEWEKESGYMVTQVKTKQEETCSEPAQSEVEVRRRTIREGLFLWMGAYGIKKDDMVKAGIELFRFLHSKGAVLKVVGELPECPISLEDGLSSEIASFRESSIKQYYMAQLILLKAGYVAVEPLVGES